MVVMSCCGMQWTRNTGYENNQKYIQYVYVYIYIKQVFWDNCNEGFFQELVSWCSCCIFESRQSWQRWGLFMWAVLEIPNACQGNSEQQHRVQANEDTSCCATQLEILRLRSLFLTRCEYLGISICSIAFSFGHGVLPSISGTIPKSSESKVNRKHFAEVSNLRWNIVSC